MLPSSTTLKRCMETKKVNDRIKNDIRDVGSPYDARAARRGIDSRQLTNWYVITGGPCSGKTTVVNLLKDRGDKTTVEDARHYVDLQRANGKSVEEVERHQREFQLRVLELQIRQEKALMPSDIVFLDRAIPDARAYYLFLGIPEAKLFTEAMKRVSYKKVFILDFLPLVNDSPRREDAAAQKKIHKLISEVYESLPFAIVHVPILPPEERVN